MTQILHQFLRRKCAHGVHKHLHVHKIITKDETKYTPKRTDILSFLNSTLNNK